MCFAPQRRALFRHVNFQKWSKRVRTWCVLDILTSKCASCHNGVQFFISHLARWLRTRRFREPIFRPSGATNHWKNTVNRHFSTFSHTCIFFLLTLSLLFSDCSHLCFSISPYCWKFDFQTSFDNIVYMYKIGYSLSLCIYIYDISDYQIIYLSIDISTQSSPI